MRLESIPSILKTMPKMHRFFALGPLLFALFLFYVILKFSGFIQVFALILFCTIMLLGMTYVYDLSKRQISASGKVKRGREDKHGILRYWDDRDDGIKDINQEVLQAQNEIFISGIVLNSILPWIKKIRFIKELASLIKENEKLTITFVLINCNAEKEIDKKILDVSKSCGERIQHLEHNWKSNLSELKEFKIKLNKELINDEQKKRIKFRCYSNMMPRHYIIKVDTTLFVSSYNYGMGGTSCLLELSKIGKKCLYEFFDSEVKFIKDHSNEFNPEDVLEESSPED